MDARKDAPANDKATGPVMNENDVDLMRGIMNGIINADGFNAAQLNDPNIQQADKEFSEILEGTVTAKMQEDVFSAHAAVLSAYIQVAVLYGIHIADVLRGAAADIPAFGRGFKKMMEAK